MTRKRNPNREKAFKLYKDNKGEITSKEIAALLNESERNINYWRTQDKWKKQLKSKVGAPFNNKNATGNNGGAPKENQNSRVHGFYSKHLPTQVFNIFETIEDMSPLDILWTEIKILYANIIRAQKIMFVKDQDDTTKELKKWSSGKGGESEEYAIQFAWEKHGEFMKAQATAMGRLTGMLNRYEKMLNDDVNLATEEQRARIMKMKNDIKLGKEKFEHQKKMDEMRMF